MEEVLDLYAEPYDEQRPVVCFDERPLQLIGETRTPLPPAPGRRQRYDFEYRRNGTGNVFALLQPRAGWRHMAVTAQRTAVDFAQQMRVLVDTHFPEATVIRVVLDNLNTHTKASLYAAFPPAEARRLAKKLEFHYTPKHASWLNMVECELSVLNGQCLNRRLPDLETVRAEIQAWQAARNAYGATVHWHFTTPQARRTLRRLYPNPA
jgi:hypothetical protein